MESASQPPVNCMTPQGKVIMDEIIEEALVSFSAELIRNKATMSRSSPTVDVPTYTSYPTVPTTAISSSDHRIDNNAPVRFLPWDIPHTVPSFSNPKPIFFTVHDAQQWLPSDIILDTSADRTRTAATYLPAFVDNPERMRFVSSTDESYATKRKHFSGGNFAVPPVKNHKRENPSQMLDRSHCQLCFVVVPDIPGSSRCLACNTLYCSQEHRIMDLSHHSSVCGIDVDSIHVDTSRKSCAACGSILPDLMRAAKCKRCETYYCHAFHLIRHKEIHREVCERYIPSGDLIYKILQTSSKPFPVKIPAKRLEAKVVSPQCEVDNNPHHNGL
jgi:hypothetical protein